MGASEITQKGGRFLAGPVSLILVGFNRFAVADDTLRLSQTNRFLTYSDVMAASRAL